MRTTPSIAQNTDLPSPEILHVSTPMVPERHIASQFTYDARRIRELVSMAQKRCILFLAPFASVIDGPDRPHKKYELDSADACLYRLRLRLNPLRRPPRRMEEFARGHRRCVTRRVRYGAVVSAMAVAVPAHGRRSKNCPPFINRSNQT